LAALFFCAGGAGSAVAQGLPELVLGFSADRVKEGLPEGWEPLTFRKIERHTRYRLARVDGITCVHAVADASASGIVYRIDAPAAERPVLRWKWKVAATLPGGDARVKQGDDFAARVYVIFKYVPGRASLGQRLQFTLARTYYGHYPPDSTLNYIWANRLPGGEAIANAFTDRAIMIAVESGNENAGKWTEHEVNILSDYRRHFGVEPPPLEGVAIMTDSDNPGGKAEAWYAWLTLSAR